MRKLSIRARLLPVQRAHGLGCVAVGLLIGACTGQIGTAPGGDPEGNGGPGNGSPGSDPSGSDPGTGGATSILDPGPGGFPDPNDTDPNSADPNVAGPAPLRRLTLFEYRNTIHDLLNIAPPDIGGFPPDRRESTGFPTADVVGGAETRAFQDAAEKIAATAMTKLSSLLPCTTANDACARQFISTFGRRAYRRPLGATEITNLQALYSKARTDPELLLGWNDAIRVVITAVLQSPNFLYRRELGPQAPLREGNLIRLNPHETASQLSYFLWSSMPDQALFEAADANKLTTAGDVAAQARRMLADPRARASVETFHENWMNLGAIDSAQKDAQQFPEWTPELRQALVAETKAFASSVMLDGDGRFETLLTAPFSFINEPLARLYGVVGVTGAALQRRDLNPDQRSGMLTQASIMAQKATPTDSDPIRRGKMVRLSLLCQALPPPPDDIPPLPARDPNSPRRAQFAAHEVGSCSACHRLMDPIGFGFENYDALGRYRATEKGSGLPIDASGEIRDMTPGQDVPFEGVKELGSVLARSEVARRCLVTQWLRFGLGRGEVAADLFSMNTAYAALANSSSDMREMLVALTQSKSFLYRAPVTGEVLQ